MKHLDLGTAEGPVLVFGGPYSNLQALKALLEQARARQIPATRIICTGDVVAYCGDPEATLNLLRDAGVALVAGNCEQQLAAGAQDCGCGFEEGTVCDLLSAGWFSHATAQMSQDQRDWMGQAADVVSFRHAGRRYGVIHGGLTDIARFIWRTSQSEVFAQEWDSVEREIGPVDAIIAGHCGLPFVKTTPQGDWINAGVIGVPAHDGTQKTWFAVLEEGKARFHALTYDVAGAVAAMTRAGLTQGYHRTLETGYWPSEDVLPPGLRRVPLAKG